MGHLWYLLKLTPTKNVANADENALATTMP